MIPLHSNSLPFFFVSSLLAAECRGERTYNEKKNFSFAIACAIASYSTAHMNVVSMHMCECMYKNANYKLYILLT